MPLRNAMSRARYASAAEVVIMCPNTECSISFASTLAFEIADLATNVPNSAGEKPLRLPKKLPIAVRCALRMTIDCIVAGSSNHFV